MTNFEHYLQYINRDKYPKLMKIVNKGIEAEENYDKEHFNTAMMLCRQVIEEIIKWIAEQNDISTDKKELSVIMTELAEHLKWSGYYQQKLHNTRYLGNQATHDIDNDNPTTAYHLIKDAYNIFDILYKLIYAPRNFKDKSFSLKYKSRDKNPTTDAVKPDVNKSSAQPQQDNQQQTEAVKDKPATMPEQTAKTAKTSAETVNVEQKVDNKSVATQSMNETIKPQSEVKSQSFQKQSYSFTFNMQYSAQPMQEMKFTQKTKHVDDIESAKTENIESVKTENILDPQKNTSEADRQWSWWLSLSDDWKEFFLLNLIDCDEEEIMNKEKMKIHLTELFSLTELDSYQLELINNGNIVDFNFFMQLERLHLRHSNMSDISSLVIPKKLTNLDISCNEISDISCLSKLENLKYLDISFNPISDISGLSKLKNLIQLVVCDNQVSDISSLSHLENLTSLHISKNPISDINSLSNLQKLEEVFIYDTLISDVSCLANLQQLEWLFLVDNPFLDINSLSYLKQVKGLFLDYYLIRDIHPLTGLEQLVTLRMMHCQLSDIRSHAQLKQLTNLKRLYLCENQISDIAPLSKLEQLTTLYLSNNQISDISPLSKLKQLTELNLSNNQISDITSLVELTQLTFLNLDKNPISDIRPIFQFKKLKTLWMRNTQVSSEDLERLTLHCHTHNIDLLILTKL